jgi:RNA methyltransferase, TrmH family
VNKVKRITSQDNPILKGVVRLKRKKDRELEGSYLIEGFHLTAEALQNKAVLRLSLIRESLLEGDQIEEIESLIKRLELNGVDVYSVANHTFDKLADTETPQGLLSVVRRKEWTAESFFSARERSKCNNILVLDRLQDPGNAGTIIRTADAAGYQGALLLKGTVDIYGAKAVRAAAGSLFRLPLLFVDSPEEAIRILRNHEKQLVATTPYCEVNYFESQMKENIALIIGNEAGGVCNVLLEGADLHIKIPMRESVESLNAAVAAGILMFESMRQNTVMKDGGRV